MSDALTPLRHAYDVEPSGPPPAPGAPEHIEWELLRGARAVLDAYVPPRPPSAVVEAVLARAAEAAPAEAPVSDPALAPLAAAAGLPLAPGVGVGDPAERALLAQTLGALDRLPRRRPRAGAVKSVHAAAAQASAAASAGLAAIRYVYDEGPAPGAGSELEVEVLRQSRQAVERMRASRPQPRPPSAVVEAVLARAAEAAPAEAPVSDPALAPLAAAAGLPLAPGVGVGDPAERALLAQTLGALDRLPRPRPPVQAVDAALARAAPPPAPRVADRAPASPTRRRSPIGLWAGAAGLVMVALVAVITFPTASELDTEPQAEATVAEAATPAPSAPEAAAFDGVEAEALQATAPEAPIASSAPPSGASLVAAPPTFAADQAPVRPESPALFEPQTRLAPPGATFAVAPPSWEADEELRALSHRLQELDWETEGLAWDEPAEAFSMPAVGPTSKVTPGIRVVREGASPARVRYSPDSSRVQR